MRMQMNRQIPFWLTMRIQKRRADSKMAEYVSMLKQSGIDLPTSGNQKLYSVIPQTVFSPKKLYFIIKTIF